MVSWEYPPVVYGGLGRHVHGLSEALVADGHEVTVLTQAHDEAPDDESVHGVRIVRVQGGDDRSDFRASRQERVRAELGVPADAHWSCWPAGSSGRRAEKSPCGRCA